PNGAIELALPLLIGIPHAHGNPIGEARTRRLFDQRHDGYRGGRLSGVIAGHWTPQDSNIDFIGGEIMHHRRGRGIDAGIDDQRVGLGISHETVGYHVVAGRRPGHDADVFVLEARIAQRVHALQAMPLLEHEGVSCGMPIMTSHLCAASVLRTKPVACGYQLYESPLPSLSASNSASLFSKPS